jgi:hypothetical protein
LIDFFDELGLRPQRLFGTFAPADIAGDLGCSDHAACRVFHG